MFCLCFFAKGGVGGVGVDGVDGVTEHSPYNPYTFTLRSSCCIIFDVDSFPGRKHTYWHRLQLTNDNDLALLDNAVQKYQYTFW